jgi:hypothetical protein
MGKQAGLRFGGHVSDNVDSVLVVGGELEMGSGARNSMDSGMVEVADVG